MLNISPENAWQKIQILCLLSRLWPKPAAIKNNYAGAISYWKSVRSLSPQNAYANLALIELYGKIKDTKMLNQEIRLLFYLQGSLKLNEYIQTIKQG